MSSWGRKPEAEAKYAFSDDDLKKLYEWIDTVPISRVKRNIARDFSDGCLTAEVIAHYFPRIIELHNYAEANSLQQKKYNWQTLNQKVLNRMSYTIPEDVIEDIITCQRGAIEFVLNQIRVKMAKYKAKIKQRKAEGRKMTPEQKPIQTMQKDNMYGNPNSFNNNNNNNNNNGWPSEDKNSSIYQNGGKMMNQQQNMMMNQSNMMMNGGQNQASMELIVEKEQTINELRSTVELLQHKINKLEQLVRLKDSKIIRLQEQLGYNEDTNYIQPHPPNQPTVQQQQMLLQQQQQQQQQMLPPINQDINNGNYTPNSYQTMGSGGFNQYPSGYSQDPYK